EPGARRADRRGHEEARAGGHEGPVGIAPLAAEKRTMTRPIETQEREAPPPIPADGTPSQPLEDNSFRGNLRRLWHNLRAAIFRTGKPTSDRSRAQKVFGNFLLHIHSTRVHRHSLRFTTTLGLGIAALASFVVATITGILLMIYYTPSTELAYQ